MAYAFTHLEHWSRVPGALAFLEWAWNGLYNVDAREADQLRALAYPAYEPLTVALDARILPNGHELSIFPEWVVPLRMVYAVLSWLVYATLCVYLMKRRDVRWVDKDA